MRKLLFLCFIMGSFNLIAQHKMKNTTMRILPGSTFSITGRSNVNTFTCHYDSELLVKSYLVAYKETSTFILLKDLKLSLETSGFDCGAGGINRDFYNLLQAEEYPEISLTIDKIRPISKTQFEVFTKIFLAGAKKNYSFPAVVENNVLRATLELDITNFGLKPPKKALGLIKVNRIIKIQFELRMEEARTNNE